MIDLGLTTAQFLQYQQLLTRNHEVRIVVQMMTLDHGYLSDISRVLVDGQVTLDFDAEVTRAASLTFYDPTNSVQIDANSPADGAMFLDRMIRIYYIVAATDRSVHFTVPIFTGPIVKLDRTYAHINVECLGKEILALDPVWTPKTFQKGANRVTVIKQLLEMTGEDHFHTTQHPSVLTNDLPVSSEDKPWSVARTLSSLVDMQLFYDGRGLCRLRPYSTANVVTFSDGKYGSVLTKPEVGYDLDGFINAVRVNGAIPTGGTQPITSTAYPPRSHPLSPWNIGRNGVPRFIYKAVDDDTVTTQSQANSLANSELSAGMYESVTTAFDMLPMPHLELHDAFLLTTEEFVMTSWIRKMTIPLSVSQPATMGYITNVRTINASKIRRRS